MHVITYTLKIQSSKNKKKFSPTYIYNLLNSEMAEIASIYLNLIRRYYVPKYT